MQARRLSPEEIPSHVAIIMDGNGRWAQDRGLSRIEGHRQGLESVRAVVRAAHELGVRVLTLYAFSLENWNRPKLEVDELMRLLEHYMAQELDEVDRNGIRVRSIGRRDLLPPSVQAKIAEAEERTRDNREMQLIFAVSYSGRAEIVGPATLKVSSPTAVYPATRVSKTSRSTRPCSSPVSASAAPRKPRYSS